jgi:hypothetical protein
MGALNYSGQYLHGHEFRIKTRIGANVSGATGDAIAGELLFETGDNGAGSVTGVLYGTTTTTSGSSPATIVRIGPSEGGGSTSPGGSDTNVQFNEGGSFGGSDYLIYDYNSEFISGASGIFDYTTGNTGHFETEAIVGTGADTLFKASGNLVEVSGDFNVSGSSRMTGSLEVASTSAGVIFPRMTSAQMQAIANPVMGEMIYNTSSGQFCGYISPGKWSAFESNP